MKAKLRAGKTGAKGRVKKYADGGITGDTFQGTGGGGTLGGALGSLGMAQSMPAYNPPPGAAGGTAGAFSDFGRAAAGGSSAFSGTAPFNLNTLLGAGSGSATGSPPTQSALQSLSGSAMGRPQTPPPMVGPRGFGPNDGGPRPGMGRPGMGKPGMGRHDMDHHHGMGRSGTGGPMAPPAPKAMTAGAQVMQNGRAFKKGGMVGCDWSPKSSATMRGAARKGK